MYALPTVVSCRCQKLIYPIMDFSNIAAGARRLESPLADVRLHAENLTRLIRADRIWDEGYAAAALRSTSMKLRAIWERLGWSFQIFEVGQMTGTEQGLDEILHNHIRMKRDDPPGVVALLTGDGKKDDHGDSFLRPLEEVHKAGHEIEVYSWSSSLNADLGDFAREHGKLILLDGSFKKITFVQGGRLAQPLGPSDFRGRY